MFNHYVLLLLLALALVVNSQTTTTTDATGHTIIQVITTNAQGQSSTRIISTLASSVPASGSTSATTTQQGPVAQPAPTTGTPGAPTPYTYTTVINGVTTAVADVFTPTSPPTVSVSPSSTGIVWSYSSWLSVYGPPKTRSSAISCSALSSSAVLVAMAAVTRWLWAA